ncbi:MAG TPA: hypothetical protein VN940_02770 [Candidatus Dormibacteraeota bacterium]|nr:hypothetical protein [Candidatus Dormibacteraeota bacterium]
MRNRLAEHRVMLVVADAARRILAQRGWDPVYGARPLKRAIQRLVQDPLAMMWLEGKISDGDTITVDAKGGDVTFTRATAVTPAAAASYERRSSGTPFPRPGGSGRSDRS